MYLNMKVGIEITNERRSAGQPGLLGALDRLLHNDKKGMAIQNASKQHTAFDQTKEQTFIPALTLESAISI